MSRSRDLIGSKEIVVSRQTIARIPGDQRSNVYTTLVSAFRRDPVERWMYPSTTAYEEHFPAFIQAFGGVAFNAGTVWGLADFAAVALWLPPGVEPAGDVIVDVLTDSVASSQLDDVFAVLDQMDDAHPTYPHWYLPWLGVRQDSQGTGLGSELLSACLETVDADHLPAYLETPNPRTVAFYQRHGFELVGEARTEACPPISFMLRPAR